MVNQCYFYFHSIPFSSESKECLSNSWVSPQTDQSSCKPIPFSLESLQNISGFWKILWWEIRHLLPHPSSMSEIHPRGVGKGLALLELGMESGTGALCPLPELTKDAQFSHWHIGHEEHQHWKAKGPNKQGSQPPPLGIWGLWDLPCLSSPSQGSRHWGGCALLSSARSTAARGSWTGQWPRFWTPHRQCLAIPLSHGCFSWRLPRICSWAAPAHPQWWCHCGISAAAAGCSAPGPCSSPCWTHSPPGLKRIKTHHLHTLQTQVSLDSLLRE